MTPAAIYTAVRDALFAAALIFVLLWVHHADTNAAKVADLRAVTSQLQSNIATQQQWQTQREKADDQHAADIAAIGTRIDAQHDPIVLRLPAAPGALSSAAPAPSCLNPSGGAADTGSGVDIRPSINEFEKRYEAAFADCRKVVSDWPTTPKAH